jgi:hypothetical protein
MKVALEGAGLLANIRELLVVILLDFSRGAPN